MSWEHSTESDGVIAALIKSFNIMGISYSAQEKEETYTLGADILELPSQHMRMLKFTSPDGKSYVAEEYLAIKDLDCDGLDVVRTSVYQDGNRPELTTQVFEPQ